MRQLSSQICHVAWAVSVTVWPGVRFAGAWISVRKTGPPSWMKLLPKYPSFTFGTGHWTGPAVKPSGSFHSITGLCSMPPEFR